MFLRGLKCEELDAVGVKVEELGDRVSADIVPSPSEEDGGDCMELRG